MELNSVLRDMGLIDVFSGTLSQENQGTDGVCGSCEPGCSTSCQPGCGSGCSGGNKG